MKNLAKIFTVALLLVATFVAQAQTTWTVTSTADSGQGTLRDIVAGANSGDIIRFDAAIDNMPIVLNSNLSIDNKSIVIIGNGVKKTVIRSTNPLNSITFNPTTTTRDLFLTNLTLGIGLYLEPLATFTLHTCVFDGRVGSSNPVSFNITQSTFTAQNPLYLFGLGAYPSQSTNLYQISYCLFTNQYNPVIASMGVLIRKYPSPTSFASVSLTACEFRDNVSENLLTVDNIDDVKINKCTFDNNKFLTNSSSAIYMQNITTSAIMNCIFRGNSGYVSSVSNANVISAYSNRIVNPKITLAQNQITGNVCADIRVENYFNTINLALTQNTIANNGTAQIKAQNLQVANSYLETSFNTINTPVSLGGNYFRNAVAWAASSDIVRTVVSFPNSPAPIFVAPVTSIPSTGGNYRLATNSILIGSAINSQVPQDIFDYDSDGNIVETVPFDIVGNPRRFDRGVDIGAYERQSGGGGLRAENGEETLTNNPQTVVYPNPANEVLNINFELSTGAEKAEIAIFNTIGQVVYQNTVNAESKAMKIDVRNFEKGLYVIKIVDNQGNTQNQKVVIQ